MIKFPVKDTKTMPWMSEREIPVIKAILSAWREKRRGDWKAYGFCGPLSLSPEEAERHARDTSFDCEMMAMIQEALRKEAKNGK